MDIGKGKFRRTDKTTHVVSRWYLPGGYDVEHARSVHIFFDDESKAKEYAHSYRMPPERADLITIRDYDNLIASTSSNYAIYKQRYRRDFE